MRSAYSDAIDSARNTLIARARRYKWLVILVSLGLAGSVLAAAVGRSFLPLLTWLWLPAGVTAFFALDLQAVHAWRRAVLAAWRDDALMLDLLDSTLRKVPTLPASTVSGMLETLPGWAGGGIPLAARPRLLRAQELFASIALQALLVRAAAWALVAVAATVAALSGHALWLAGAGLAPALWFVWKLVSRWRVRALRAAWSAPAGQQAANGPAQDGDSVSAWLAALNRQGVPHSLDAIAAPAPVAF